MSNTAVKPACPSIPMSRRDFGQALGVATATAVVANFAAMVPAKAQPAIGGSEQLCEFSAVDMAAKIRRKEVSAREVMEAHLLRIERVNPQVNAIVTLVAEQAMEAAARADEVTASGQPLGVLHGVPVAHKDLVDTAGIRTTQGSPFYRENIPTRDAEIITRIRAAGALTLGKTNTPEFGAGSQTFNSVFGATRNPYDTSKTCGGSSGGAAVALACGMVPIADGSDFGGSLRNPAAWCSIVGLRPSPGRVPGTGSTWSPLGVSGPMARSVADLALFLSAMAGSSPGNSLSINESGAQFRQPLERDFKGARIAWWRDLGGIPVEDEIRQIINANRRMFEDLGCVVEEMEPDFSGVAEALPVLRFTSNYPRYAELIRQRRDWVKDTIQYEVAQAESYTGATIGRALARQNQMYIQSRQLFEQFDYFVLPVTQVSPFDVNVPYPTEINGIAMNNYIDWMRSCWYVTFMANPAMSVPAGFTASGLPVGIQIVGRHQDDWSLLQLAHAFEQATRHGQRRPALLGA